MSMFKLQQGATSCETESHFGNSNERDWSVRTGIKSGNLGGWLISAYDCQSESGLRTFDERCPIQLWERDVNLLGTPLWAPIQEAPGQLFCPSVAPLIVFPWDLWTLHSSALQTSLHDFSIILDSLEMGQAFRFPPSFCSFHIPHPSSNLFPFQDFTDDYRETGWE